MRRWGEEDKNLYKEYEYASIDTILESYLEYQWKQGHTAKHIYNISRYLVNALTFVQEE